MWPRKLRTKAAQETESPAIVDPNARPDFLCIGAQKGGTTWLFEQLNSHDDFWMPPLKEINYFFSMSRSRHPDRAARSKLRPRDERDRRFLRAMEDLCTQPQIDLDRYAQLFSPKGPLLSGDVSPGYAVVPEEIIAQIVKRFPELKVIFIARDPVERAWSNLSVAIRSGRMRAFDASQSEEVQRQLLHPDIVMRSFPSVIVERWQRHIRPELFRIYFFDALESEPMQLRRSIIEFLGGDPEKASRGVKPDQKINETKAKLAMPDEAQATIARFFEAELRACASKLGGSAEKWPARYGFS
jgi:Sulfotransferase family